MASRTDNAKRTEPKRSCKDYVVSKVEVNLRGLELRKKKAKMTQNPLIARIKTIFSLGRVGLQI